MNDPIVTQFFPEVPGFQQPWPNGLRSHHGDWKSIALRNAERALGKAYRMSGYSDLLKATRIVESYKQLCYDLAGIDHYWQTASCICGTPEFLNVLCPNCQRAKSILEWGKEHGYAIQ